MRLALLQISPCHDLDQCLALLETHLQAARAQGAEVLVTPEMWLGGYNIPPAQIAAHAAQFDQLAGRISQIVRRCGVGLVLGCAMPGTDKPLNTAIAFDAAGQQVAHYAKCHLFCGLDEDRFTPGDQLSPVFDLAGMRVGLAICYDIEFPETARSLALRGAQIILVPTANMTPYESVSRRLVPARAEENGVFVAYANLCGREGDLEYCGLSCLCGPQGDTRVIAGATSEILFADVDPADVVETQTARPFLKDRHAALYFKKET